MRLNPLRRRKGPRPRRRFSLNALAIQLSAFALSFTLVALLVVSGSQAAFVEENEVVAEYAANATPPATPGKARPARGAPPAPAETLPVPPPAEAPIEEPAEEPVQETPTEVALTDSDAGTAMFQGETLLPGAPVDRCIEVAYDGDADPGPVLLYAAAAGGDLAPYLDLTIDLGSAEDGAFGGCATFTADTTAYAGTLADFGAAHPAYAFGLPTWDPDAAEATRSFRFRLVVRDVPAAAGKSATFGFTWRTEAA